MSASRLPTTDIQIVDEILLPSSGSAVALRYHDKDYYLDDGIYHPDPNGKKTKQLIFYSFKDGSKTSIDQKRVYELLLSDPRYEIKESDLSMYKIEGVNYFDNDDGLIRAVDVTVVKPEFIYEPYFPKGKLTVIGAYPGSGKTMLMSYLAAKLTRGQSFFGCRVDQPHNVLYFSTEDGVDDTLQLRFQQAGGDNERQFYYKNIISFSELLKIGNLIDQCHADVVIFDPLQSYASAADLNNAVLTRQMFDSLEQVAQDRHVTTIIVCHFNKNAKGPAITRILGSTDITGKARSFIAVGNMPGNDGQKFFSHEKSNLAKQGLTQIFRIDPNNGLLIPDGTTTKHYDDFYLKQSNGQCADKLDTAKRLLLENLDENGCILASDAYKLAQDEGISISTMKTARSDLGMYIPEKKGFQGKTIWKLPDPLTSEDFDDIEGLIT